MKKLQLIIMCISLACTNAFASKSSQTGSFIKKQNADSWKEHLKKQHPAFGFKVETAKVNGRKYYRVMSNASCSELRLRECINKK